jgi:hypothetical protein
MPRSELSLSVPIVGVPGGRLCLVDLRNKACAPPFLARVSASLRSWPASVAGGEGLDRRRGLGPVVAGAERLPGAPAQLQEARRWRPTSQIRGGFGPVDYGGKAL